jgi:ribosome-binding ATPase
MSLSIGIVGLPNVGKSTLFNALTKQSVLAANYPFATIEPNLGIVNVPDERLDKLAALYESQRIVPATVSFVDIAGLVKGASEGQGMGNQFLANIRESSAVCQMVRAFNDPNVVHVSGKIDPKDDIETINTELILADLQTIERRLPRLQSEAKRGKEAQEILDAALGAQKILDGGSTLSSVGFQSDLLGDFHFLTAKPFIYVFNLDEKDLSNKGLQSELSEMIRPHRPVFLCAQVEAELVDLPEDEAAELLQAAGQEVSGLNQLIRLGYETLGLQTFLTAGPKEVRAWTIKKGATAPEAAGVIHTDFQKHFIRAEVVAYDDLISAGSLAEARSQGKVRIEGKDYVMREGDVVEFRTSA